LSSALPGGGNPISIESIEELQVVIAPYDVRQTNFIGGGVNAITKSVQIPLKPVPTLITEMKTCAVMLLMVSKSQVHVMLTAIQLMVLLLVDLLSKTNCSYFVNV
jgi:hypothetical protein